MKNGLEKIVKVSLAAERGDSVVASNEDEEGAPSTIGRSIIETNQQRNITNLIRKMDPLVAITEVGDDEELGSIATGTPGPIEQRMRRGGGGGGSSVRSGGRSRKRRGIASRSDRGGSTRSLVTQ